MNSNGEQWEHTAREARKHLYFAYAYLQQQYQNYRCAGQFTYASHFTADYSLRKESWRLFASRLSGFSPHSVKPQRWRRLSDHADELEHRQIERYEDAAE